MIKKIFKAIFAQLINPNTEVKSQYNKISKNTDLVLLNGETSIDYSRGKCHN